MFRRNSTLAAILILGGTGVHCLGQSPIRVMINEVEVQQRTSGQNILIQVDGDPGTPGIQPLDGLMTIRIYDVNSNTTTAPTANIGRVTIEGSATSNGELRVLVKADAGFPANPLQPIGSLGSDYFGFPELGTGPAAGLFIVNPADPSDDSLARQTRFAAAVLNEITGTITVGQVQRLQAGINSEAFAQGQVARRRSTPTLRSPRSKVGRSRVMHCFCGSSFA